LTNQGIRLSDALFQLDQHGAMRHFLTIDGLEKAHLLHIIERAKSFIDESSGDIRGDKNQSTKRTIKDGDNLKDKTVVNLFFENSTRTRTTFEIAAKRLQANVINLNAQRMSTSKGETLLDTMQNLEAMHTDMFVIRDSHAGAAYLIAHHAQPHVRVVNAGDGRHAHPTQAMLDAYTILDKKGDLSNLSVAIVGDILHSRVARSEIQALRTLGCKDIRVIAPYTLLPTGVEELGVTAHTKLEQGIAGVDVVIMLRLQRERMLGHLIASEQEYFNLYGLTQDKVALADSNAIIMHPGPMNRGLEISSEVADSDQAVILEQVTNGIATRMSIMSIVMESQAAN